MGPGKSLVAATVTGGVMMGWECYGDVAMNDSCTLLMGWEGDYIYALCTLYMHLRGTM